MNLETLRDDCALMVHDPSYNELSQAQWLTLVRSAAQDARSSGWMIPIEDSESITCVGNTFEYDIPTGFAYIDGLLIEETITGSSVYVRPVPNSHWEPRLNGGVAVFSFNTITELTVGKHIKVIGQARPSIYVNADQNIDAGMESFIRERALYFAFRYLGAGRSELAGYRQQMAQQAWTTSELFLKRHPQEFRVHPSAKEVPGRA